MSRGLAWLMEASTLADFLGGVAILLLLGLSRYFVHWAKAHKMEEHQYGLMQDALFGRLADPPRPALPGLIKQTTDLLTEFATFDRRLSAIENTRRDDTGKLDRKLDKIITRLDETR